MKKSIFFAFLFLVSFNGIAQDVDFGFNAGYTNITGRSSDSNNNLKTSASSSGFYVGALADFDISGNFHIQPSVNYASADNTNFLIIPVLAQYYISDSSFYVQAGPQATLILEDTFGLLDTFGLDIAFGAGYHITENFFLEAKYSLELTNRLTKDVIDATQNSDVDSGFDAFSVGVGYKF